MPRRVIWAFALALAGAAAHAAEGDDEAAYYRVEDLPTPKGVVMEVGGLALSPDGTLYVATRRGDIWARKETHGRVRWWQFAAGLHEPLGLLALGNGDLAAAQRPELTRVRDVNGDGRADVFDRLASGWGINGNYHEYHYGPVRDAGGNLYGTLNLAWEGRGTAPSPYRGWMYKLTPAGEFVPYALGFRSPAGIGIGPDGDLFVTDNQGDWMPTSPLYHVEAGAFYGHPASLKWETGYRGPADPIDLPSEDVNRRRHPAAAWFVYGVLGHSPTEPVWDLTGGRFGVFGEQMFVGDQTKSLVLRVMLEKVDGQYQGAIAPFRRGLATGITRMAFDRDGSLIVGGTDRGWGAVGGKAFALQRIVWTGRIPFEIAGVALTPDGFELTFTKPIAPATAMERAFVVQHFTYKFWKTYGSPHVDTTAAPVTAVRISPDGKRVRLTLPAMAPGRVYSIEARGITAADGAPLLHGQVFYTLNRVKRP